MSDNKDIKIAIKIDCSKINKGKLFKGRNGAQYLDATVYLKSEPDQYGNYGMITQDKTKDVSDNGKNIILGNIKVWNDGGNTSNNEKPSDTYANAEPVDDLPF